MLKVEGVLLLLSPAQLLLQPAGERGQIKGQELEGGLSWGGWAKSGGGGGVGQSGVGMLWFRVNLAGQV